MGEAVGAAQLQPVSLTKSTLCLAPFPRKGSGATGGPAGIATFALALGGTGVCWLLQTALASPSLIYSLLIYVFTPLLLDPELGTGKEGDISCLARLLWWGGGGGAEMLVPAGLVVVLGTWLSMHQGQPCCQLHPPTFWRRKKTQHVCALASSQKCLNHFA